MVDMEAVRQFNNELSTIYETKPPISKGKVASITRLAVKAIKYYKHVVQSVEKFTQKCREEYKVPALYIIDSIIRQSRHQFGSDKDVFGPRFGKCIDTTFQHLFKCPPEDQGRIVKVLNLWQKGCVYPPEVVQPLLNMAQHSSQDDEPSQSMETVDAMPTMTVAANQGQEIQPSIPGSGTFVNVLQHQQQQHLEQIEQLQRQLQEQQSINQQQQQQITQQLGSSGEPNIAQPTMSVDNQAMQFQSPQMHQGGPQVPDVLQVPQGGPSHEPGADQPRFQLQPHVLAQIQALTGMNIRLPQPIPSQSEDQGPPVQNQQQATSNVQAMNDQESPWGHPGLGQHRPQPEESVQHSNRKEQNMLDDFDYGDEQDDATRLAEQRRHLMEEERRLSQEQMSMERVCSSTIWVGHLAKSVQQDNLQEIFVDFGEVTSIDMVPPRGCAYVQMAKRDDANKAVSRLSNLRLHGNFVKLAWAPAKGVKDRKYKEYFNVELGVTYIPWDVLGSTPDLQALAEGGWVDPESLPTELQNALKAAESQGEKDTEGNQEDQSNPLANQVLPTQIPTHLPPPGHPMFPPMMPPPMMMRPPFPGGPNMLPPDGAPWGLNMPGGPPPGFNPGVPPPQGIRHAGGATFPFHQTGDNPPHFHPRLPMGMHSHGQEPGGMQQFRPRFPLDGTSSSIPGGGHRGPNGPPREGHHKMGEGPPRDFDGQPRTFNGLRGGPRGPPPRGQERGPDVHFMGPDRPRDQEGQPIRHDRPRFDGPPRGLEGPQPRHEGPRFDGPQRGLEGPQPRHEGPRFDGPQRGLEGPQPRHEGPRFDGPQRGLEGPQPRHEGPRFDGPTRGPEGPLIRREGPRFDGPPRGSEGPPIRHERPRFDGPPRGPEGPPIRHEGPRFDGPPRGPEGPPIRHERPRFDGPPRGPEGPPIRHEGPRFDGPPRGPEGPPIRHERPRFDGPPRGPDGPPIKHEGPRFDGPPRGPEGPSIKQEGPRFDGPPRGPEGPSIKQEGPRFDGPPRGPEGPPIRQERPRFDGPPRGPDGPPIKHEGPTKFEGPSDGPPKQQEGSIRFGGPPNPQEGPPRDEGAPDRMDGPPGRFEGLPRGPTVKVEGQPGPLTGMDGPNSGPDGAPRGPEFRGGPPRHWGLPLDRPMGGPSPIRTPLPEWQRGPPPEQMQEERKPLEKKIVTTNHLQEETNDLISVVIGRKRMNMIVVLEEIERSDHLGIAIVEEIVTVIVIVRGVEKGIVIARKAAIKTEKAAMVIGKRAEIETEAGIVIVMVVATVIVNVAVTVTVEIVTDGIVTDVTVTGVTVTGVTAINVEVIMIVTVVVVRTEKEVNVKINHPRRLRQNQHKQNLLRPKNRKTNLQ
ncbi:hypothetical protein QZH41_019729 [Actinostola sp. cb2023]|nr:hypothetical protein QZH41_019729 [Actinostola sp. cb2023]